MSHLGFTGTQHEISDYQKWMIQQVLQHYLLNLSYRHFHHGDCIGADAFAATYAYAVGYLVHCHPPVNQHKRAFTKAHVTHPALPYLERNAEIVRTSSRGLAVPSSMKEVLRSGTWSTIRKFRKAQIPCWIVAPSSYWIAT